MKTFTKDPDAVLDYTIDWSEWLAAGETITGTPTWTVPGGITKDSQSNDTTSVTAWFSSGSAGTDYVIGCKIATSDSRTDERSIILSVEER